jgi:hypothetical protein
MYYLGVALLAVLETLGAVEMLLFTFTGIQIPAATRILSIIILVTLGLLVRILLQRTPCLLTLVDTSHKRFRAERTMDNKCSHFSSEADHYYLKSGSNFTWYSRIDPSSAGCELTGCHPTLGRADQGRCLQVFCGIKFVSRLSVLFFAVCLYTMASFYIGLGLAPKHHLPPEVTGLSLATLRSNWGPGYQKGGS